MSVASPWQAPRRRESLKIDFDIVAVEADGDHLHLMVLYPPRLGLSEIVRRMKGASSRAVRKARLPEVLRKLRGRRLLVAELLRGELRWRAARAHQGLCRQPERAGPQEKAIRHSAPGKEVRALSPD